ncbi:TPA: hypothetical protein ACH3X1_016812 [Trebouxia sp. C0004]
MFLTCMLCMGLPVWETGSQLPMQPSSSYSVAKCDLVPDRLPGAAMSSPAAVFEPAWLGSKRCVKYTRMSSGMAVSMVLPVTWCMLCIHSASSLAAALLAFRVLALTDFCCMSAAVVKPVLYRLSHCCWLSFGVEEVGVLVAHMLE